MILYALTIKSQIRETQIVCQVLSSRGYRILRIVLGNARCRLLFRILFRFITSSFTSLVSLIRSRYWKVTISIVPSVGVKLILPIVRARI